MATAYRKLRVFLCHASQDQPIVWRLYQRLLAEGWIEPWLDKDRILPGQQWQVVIEEAVEKADIVLVFLSNHSVQKEGFVQRELRYACVMALEKPEDAIFLIPVRIEECQVPRSLKNLQWLNYFGGEAEDSYKSLLRALSRRYQQAVDIGHKNLARQEAEEKARVEVEEKVLGKTLDSADQGTMGRITVRPERALLLVTTDAVMGQQLSASLEQEGYSVRMTGSKGESLLYAEVEYSPLAFLDMDMGYQTVLEIGRDLRLSNPDISLIVFSREEDPPKLDKIQPWMLSPKPYYLPDVLNMLNEYFAPRRGFSFASIHQEIEMSNSSLPWWTDVGQATQHLRRMALKSSAQAALIIRNDELWAYAGKLSEVAIKEVVVAATRHREWQKSDLLRFVYLESTKAQHSLYATHLKDDKHDMVLALVFSTESTFITLRKGIDL